MHHAQKSVPVRNAVCVASPSTGAHPILSLFVQVLNMAGDQLPELKLSSFSELDKRSMSATMVKHLKYLVGREASKMSR